MEQLRFFCVKDSVAAAKTDISTYGVVPESTVEPFGELEPSFSNGEACSENFRYAEGCALSIERAESKPRLFGARNE